MRVQRETLATRYEIVRRTLAATGFTEDANGLWTRGNETARLVESPNLNNGEPVPERFNGKPVDPVHKEPKLSVEYGTLTDAGPL